VKMLLHLYLVVVPMVVFMVKDLWPAFWPGPWVLLITGVTHAVLVFCYGFMEWEGGNRSWAEVEVGSRKREWGGVAEAEAPYSSSGR
jgi:hypothetical protein